MICFEKFGRKVYYSSYLFKMNRYAIQLNESFIVRSTFKNFTFRFFLTLHSPKEISLLVKHQFSLVLYLPQHKLNTRSINQNYNRSSSFFHFHKIYYFQSINKSATSLKQSRKNVTWQTYWTSQRSDVAKGS